jgi:hypothetical protein
MELVTSYSDVLRLVTSVQTHALTFQNRTTREPQRISIQP